MRTRAARAAVVVAFLVALATFALAPRAPAASAPGSFAKHTFPAQPGVGPRDYWIYAPPAGAGSGPYPLVVFLHGCTQTVPDAALGTRWNLLAAKRGFVIAWPQQAPFNADYSDGNGSLCWNWFEPQHQARDKGEPASIAGITRLAMATENVDPRRVYVIGISAGADMAGIMAATYPDLYAAGGMVAGCAYLTCADVGGQAAKAAMGSRARAMPMFIEQGTADSLNNFAMGLTMVRQWVATDDLADDGAANGSVATTPKTTEHHGVDPSALGGAGSTGDACVGNSRFPCAGGLLGTKGAYPYTVEHYVDAKGAPLVDFWIIHGLNHAYPAGDTKGTFTDPLGPDITTAAYEFFAAHPMAGAPAPVAATQPGAAGAAPVAAPAGPSLPATGGRSAAGACAALVALAVALRKFRHRVAFEGA